MGESAVRFFARPAVRLTIAGVVAFSLLTALWLALTLTANEPVRYTSIEDHYKYGSIGSEPGVSLLRPVGGVLPPYWVFRALPTICSDRLPDGYASFGFVVEPGHDLPVGVSRRHRIGIDHVGLNCAVCHSRHGARHAHLGAPGRAGDAGTSARSPGLRAVRPRLHPRQPHDGRSRARDVPARWRARHLRTPAPAHRPDGPPQAADARPQEPDRAHPPGARAPVGPRARGHLQPVQGHPVQLEPRSAAGLGAGGRVGLPVAVEPEAARRHAPPLGWRQRLGGRAQPERRPRRRHHARDRRSRRR